MKIVMFTDAYWPRVNGVTVSVDSYSHALVNMGQEVLIICSSYPEGANIPIPFQDSKEENKPKIVRVPSIPAFVTKEDRIAKFNKLYWVFKQVDLFNPDIIHINTEMMLGGFGFWYAKTHNLPAVYTFHTMWEDYAPIYFPMFPSFMVKFVIRKLHKNILSRSYRVIVPTPQVESVARKYKLNTKTFLLPTGIELGLFERDEAESVEFRKKLEELFPILKEKRILLFSGRVAKEKNIGFLLNILPEIIGKHPDVVLLIAGNGPDLDYFRDEARDKGVENYCVFTGYFDRKDLALVYAMAEVFVFPSLTDTQGLVTLESMLSGTPVVAIGAMGTLTVMGGDNGGFMVKNDAPEFTRRVLELLSDPELRRRKSIEAKSHARSWSIEELTKKLIAMYETTITDYVKEYGYRINPMWELLMSKRWWKINNKILRKRTKRKWRQMLSKLGYPAKDVNIP
ncbi:MAG: glycosyltransferase [Treponema sp.]|jgi:glycosyltransferase involved in cell wall biosynthesis|nr:glycosyltransferase [Treponema sp.]